MGKRDTLFHTVCSCIPQATYEWFRFYKKPDGKPENTVHWKGECQNKVYIDTEHCIKHCQ